MMNQVVDRSALLRVADAVPDPSGNVVFPTTAPEAGTWLPEGELIPGVQLYPRPTCRRVQAASLHFIRERVLQRHALPLAQEIGRKLAEPTGPN